MRTVKVRAVGINHPGKTEGLVLHFEELIEAAHQARLHTLVLILQIVLAINRLAHVHAAQKIMIFAWHGTELRVGGQILQVCFNHRRAGGERLHEFVFPLNEAIHNIIHRDGLSSR